MPVHHNLAVPHHQQDTNYYCGAACAQMVLETIGAGLLDQDPLYADNHAHSTTDVAVNWYTGPDGLEWTMNDRRPAGFSNIFVLFALGSEDAISRKIVWTIHHYNVAPIALVYGWDHWIVVRGYQASDAPSSSADNSYTITSFDINNPWPYAPSWDNPALAPPPPHAAGDGCGTGGNRGVADENVSYATWQSTYMTGVPGGHWAGQFLAVCDPEPPPKYPGEQQRPKRLDGERIIEPDMAAEFAVNGLHEYGLYERKQWGRTLEGTEPGEPVLVQHLDRPDTFYYIVPMQFSPEKVPVLVSVDARFGDYRQASAIHEGESQLIARHEPDELLKMVVGQKFDLGDREGRLLVREQALCLYPIPVWKPCRESLSPFWPFYMFSVGDQRLYVRIDGAVFTKLHDQDPGI
jgi:hypothetical protein